MAEKKTTKKTKTTKTKKTSPKKIKVTYNPIGFTAETISFPLRKKDENGRNIPLIEGLPMDFIVKKGEIIELTETQFKKLQGEKCIESDEEHEKRTQFLKNMKDQYPQTFADLEKSEREGNLISSVESQRIIYSDKLIRCD